MPRNYVKKKKPPRYTVEDIRRAVEDVTEKRKTFRQASEYYGIPTAVIYHRIKGRKVSLDRMGGGVSKALPDHVEQHLVNCLKTRARMNHPCHKEEFLMLVGEYVKAHKIKTPFKDNIPGDCWYQSFMKRNPSLSLKKPEILQKARTDARRPHVVYDFYDMLSKEITENNLKDKPRYIFNADESGFHSDPSKLRAIGEKGTALSRVTGGSGRESTSVLACVAADGTFLPPCIVFKGVAVQARWVSDKAYPGTLFGATKNGWMEEPTFHNWLINGFIPYVDNIRKINNEPNHKVILIYDGHSSHISVRIVEDAINANIILVKFPSHLTDRIQPLDKCVFGPVKRHWEKTLVEHGIKQMGKGTGHLSKEKFTELLGEVWAQAFTTKNIVSGFNTTGIFPVDATKFSKKIFNPIELQIYHNLINALNEKETDFDANCDNSMSTEESPNFPGEFVPTYNGSTSTVCTDQRDEPAPENIILTSDLENAIDNNSSTKGCIEEHANLVCSGFEICSTSNTINMARTTSIPHCSNFDEHTLTVQDNVIPSCSVFQQPTTSIHADVGCEQPLKDITGESAIPDCSTFEGHAMNDSVVLTNNENSSPLVNKILKLISLDTTANDAIKAKILKAISSTNGDDDKADDIMSPNKETLEKLFKLQKNSPEKKRKIVVPRLKVATYGEVLTTDAVKERLKQAEEAKNGKGLKKRVKTEKNPKNKSQGKRTKSENLNKKDDKENSDSKKAKFDESNSNQKEKVEKTSKDLDKPIPLVNVRQRNKVYDSDIEESEEEEIIVPYAESEDSDYNAACETVTEDCEFLETTSVTDKLTKGNFVLVMFKGGKRLTITFRYLCMVDSIDEEDSSEILVTSLKSIDSSKQVFALNENDMSSVSIKDVIGVLPEPILSLKGERIFYKFPKPIDISEKM